MRHRTGGRANLFLVELVLNLLIFALCAAVCMGLLSRARSMSQESAALTRAVYLAQDAAEPWRASGKTPVWNDADEDGFTGRFTAEGGALDIAIYQDGRLIYTLEGVTAP